MKAGDNANAMLAFIMLILVIIVIWAILLSVYSGSATVIPSVSAQDSSSQEESEYLLYLEGTKAYQQGMYEQAIEYYDRLLAMDPNHFGALIGIGDALSSLGRLEQAIEYYDRLLAMDPRNVRAFINKGVALGNLGRHQEAIEYYDRALGIDSKKCVCIT